ncbi:unnamed protein product [Heligmosomoides polygyrus]|uniref:Uncharacterized protein n=1 Tax=Heligmosomoides polygyrus TaxID=6339 RepID=A0A183GSS2_HELPZ|nr:unnamed protein product [Heligmosomoides polygyrus]
MFSDARVVLHLLTLEFGSPSDAPPSWEEKKLAGRIASMLKTFEEKQLEDVYDEVHLEIKEDCLDAEQTMGDEEKVDEYNQAGESGTVTFSGGLQRIRYVLVLMV